MKLYAVSIQAQQPDDRGVRVHSMAESCVAVGPDEALGKAYTLARQEWPVTQGWNNHNVAVCEIPQRQIDDVTPTGPLCPVCLRREVEAVGMSSFADEFEQARKEAGKEIEERAEEMSEEDTVEEANDDTDSGEPEGEENDA